jgi:hypothetical protein
MRDGWKTRGIANERAMMKRCLMAICSAVLVVSAMSAQGQAPPLPKATDEGPSLQVTMQFIQEKLKAKLPVYTDITADPANCQITFARHDGSDSTKWVKDFTTAFSFREVEKVEVMPIVEYLRATGQEEAARPYPPDTFVLRVLTTTEKSVHQHNAFFWKGKLDHSGDTYRGYWASDFTDEDTPNRLAKAMVHAVELCGGGSKPEPF